MVLLQSIAHIESLWAAEEFRKKDLQNKHLKETCTKTSAGFAVSLLDGYDQTIKIFRYATRKM